MLIVNIYKDIIIIFGWYFIPIIILLYLAAMISNAYSSITSKWFMDIKYITLNRILIYLGTIGLFYSLAFLFVLSFISCSDKNHSFMNNICKFKYKNDLFYENYRTLGEIIADSHLYIDIFVIIPIYMASSFFIILFELLIIKDLDPFYLIPIDCLYFLIYEIIDYCLTYKLADSYRNSKLACKICSNIIAIILSSIYLEIIELHFCYLDRHLRRNITIREEDEKQKLMHDIDESLDSESFGLESNKN